MVSDIDGKQRLEDSGSAPSVDAAKLGRQLAERLLARGARDILGR
jgi:porphobilinogen deaminase